MPRNRLRRTNGLLKPPRRPRADGHVIDWQSLVPPTWDIRTLPQVGLFLLAVLYTLYFAKPLLMPVVLAVFLSFLFRPVVRWLTRHRVPDLLAAMLVLVLVFGTIGAGVARLADPAREWMQRAPQSIEEVRRKVGLFMRPAVAMSQAAQRVEQAVAARPAPGIEHVQQVQLKKPGFMGPLLTGTTTLLGELLIVIGLLFFLLSAGDRFLRKWVKLVPTFAQKRRAVAISHELVAILSGYLTAVTGINVGLGLLTGLAMHMLGMPNPFLWGALGGLMNFVPYLGALVMVVVLSLVGFVQFDSVGQAVLPALVYWVLTILESSFITPWLLGHRFSLNPVMIFLSLVFWGWLWGIPGTLMAVPILMAIKIICDRSKSLQPVGELLGL